MAEELLGVNIFGDHSKLGRQVADWAKDQTSWPQNENLQVLTGVSVAVVKDTVALKAFLKDGNMVDLPDRIKTVIFLQPDKSTYVVRLPPKALVEQSERQINARDQPYELPDFYRQRIDPDVGTTISDIDLLYARIGDYTFAHCM